MPKDTFTGFQHTPSSPATSIAEITPDDASDLAKVTIGLNVAVPGTVRVTMQDGSVGDISVQPGMILPLRVSRIWETGTTATGIRALY